MADYTVEQLKDAARRAFEDNNIAVTKKLIARAKALEASQAKAAQPENVTAIEDISKAGAGGFTRGAAETADMSKSIIDAPTRLGISALRALGIGTDQSAEAAQRALDTPEGKSARELANKFTGGLTEYDPQTLLGEYAGTTGEFVGGAAAMPIGGPLRSIGSAIVPALASETAGQVARAKAPELEGTARLLAALGVPAAQTAATPALRRMAIGDPKQVSDLSRPTRDAQVRVLEEAGIQDLTAGQRIGSKNLMRLEGRLEPTVRQNDELTLAATRMAGIDGLATPENLTKANSRITSVFDEFDDLISQPATMREADQAAFLLDSVEGAGANYTAPKSIREVVAAIEDSAFDNKPIIGIEFRRLRELMRDVIKRNLGDDMLTVGLADDLIDLLEGMAVRQVSQTAPDLLPALQTANKQYRALMTIEKAVSRSGSGAALGRVTPETLATSVRVREGAKPMIRGTGSDTADLALAAQGVMTPLARTEAGGVRHGQSGLLGTILQALPRTVAKYSQDTLTRPANQVMTERLLQRLARQSGGLLNIED